MLDNKLRIMVGPAGSGQSSQFDNITIIARVASMGIGQPAAGFLRCAAPDPRPSIFAPPLPGRDSNQLRKLQKRQAAVSVSCPPLWRRNPGRIRFGLASPDPVS